MTSTPEAMYEPDRPSVAAAAEAPVVSVVVLTCNHEKFIEQALASVLSQRCRRPIEVLVADDRSTDRTRSVLDRLGQARPGTFRVLDRVPTPGRWAHLEAAMRQCRGRYISLLEGDDFWCDDLRLEKVIESLDAHPEWSGCFDGVRVECKLAHCPEQCLPPPAPPWPFRIEDLLSARQIVTNSAVTYRRGLVPSFPEWLRRLESGDWGLQILHADCGPMGCLPDAMTVYRVHEGDRAAALNEPGRWQQTFSLWAAVDAHFSGRYAEVIELARHRFVLQWETKYADFNKIHNRYFLLRIDLLAALLRPVKSLLKRWRRRSRTTTSQSVNRSRETVAGSERSPFA